MQKLDFTLAALCIVHSLHFLLQTVCVWGVKDQKEFWNKCEKGKGKEGDRRLSTSVKNIPSTIVQG